MRRTKHSFTWEESGVILRSRPKTQHHQRYVINPVQASHAGSESQFQGTVKFSHYFGDENW